MSTRSLLTLAVTLGLGILLGAGAMRAQQGTPAPTRANAPSPQKDEWMRTLNNRGRWGAADELGTLNLVTEAKRRQALALAKTGTVVSLSRVIVPTEKSAAIKADGKPDGTPYFEFRFRAFADDNFYAGFASDIQEFAMHGALLTHLDGLCHDSYQGERYNG